MKFSAAIFFCHILIFVFCLPCMSWNFGLHIYFYEPPNALPKKGKKKKKYHPMSFFCCRKDTKKEVKVRMGHRLTELELNVAY